MKIAFTCVNYNNHEVTFEYIQNVKIICKNIDFRIIVVDNASNDTDLITLEKFLLDHPDVILIKSSRNEGYFKGLNLGISWAIKNGFNEFQVIGNNDIKLHDDFISNLRSIKLNENELVIAPDVITRNGIHENPHVIKRVSQLRKVAYSIYYSNYYLARIINCFYSTERKPKSFDPQRKHIYMGIGAVYILTPYFFRHFNKLWDDLFLYGEEALFAGQIASVDGKILYEPLLKCDHNESSTTSKLGSKKKYNIVKESYLIYRKYL